MTTTVKNKNKEANTEQKAEQGTEQGTDKGTKRRKKVQIPSGEPAGRLICPECGNDRDFVELATNVILTTHFVQNRDGSFSPVDHQSDVLGEVRLLCAHCDTDITRFHAHFQEMVF